VQSDLVLLRFHVLKKDRDIQDLDVSEIEIRENGQIRSVAVFEGFQQPDLLADAGNAHTGIGSKAVISLYAFAGETRRLSDMQGPETVHCLQCQGCGLPGLLLPAPN